MASEKSSLDAVLAAFKVYQQERRKETRARLARIKTLREAVEAEAVRLQATTE